MERKLCRSYRCDEKTTKESKKMVKQTKMKVMATRLPAGTPQGDNQREERRHFNVTRRTLRGHNHTNKNTITNKHNTN